MLYRLALKSRAQERDPSVLVEVVEFILKSMSKIEEKRMFGSLF